MNELSKHWTDEISKGFNSINIPERMRGGIVRYILDGVEPGHFLSAVLTNDLTGAFGRADDENVRLIGDYIKFFYNYAPSGCWRSPENFKEWLKAGGCE